MLQPDDVPGVEEDPIFHDQGETSSITSDAPSAVQSESASDKSTPNRLQYIF